MECDNRIYIDYKDEDMIEKLLSLDSVYKNNVFVKNHNTFLQKYKDDLILADVTQYIDKLDINNIIDVRGNLFEFSTNYNEDIRQAKDKGISIYVALYKEENPAVDIYEGFIEVTSGDGIYIIKYNGDKIKILNPSEYMIQVQRYEKIVPKELELMKLKDYIDSLNKIDDYKKYKHQVRLSNKIINIFVKNEGIEFRDSNNKPINDINKYLDLDVIHVSIGINI
ncbi:hypothetical protein GCM10008905_16480 [Clostridium malenominatum]|uniref:Uncharacterized protein n=1 Tax=Clostridium malenominatum TaxID=1539 RepID=A0ABN1IY59_9CLOT